MTPVRPKSQRMQAQWSDFSHSPVETAMRPFPSGAIQTDVLFQGSLVILINHNGEHYRLRITKNGKLILTK